MPTMNYSFNVMWSEEDKAYVATCPEFPGLSAFGDSTEEALAEATVAMEGFIEAYREEGRELPEPASLQSYSGQLRVRMPRRLHALLAGIAEREGVSLNALIVSYLSEMASGEGAVNPALEKLNRLIEQWELAVAAVRLAPAGFGTIVASSMRLEYRREAEDVTLEMEDDGPQDEELRQIMREQKSRTVFE